MESAIWGQIKESFLVIQQNFSKLIELIEEPSTTPAVDIQSTGKMATEPAATPITTAISVKDEVTLLLTRW